MSDADIARVPVGNLRVPPAEFAALWSAAEEACDRQVGASADWYVVGVVTTCEWLAAATIRAEGGQHRLAYSPATGRADQAYEELIDAEIVAAERLSARVPCPGRLQRRPGWIEGVVDTLRWVWKGVGVPPLPLHDFRTS